MMKGCFDSRELNRAWCGFLFKKAGKRQQHCSVAVTTMWCCWIHKHAQHPILSLFLSLSLSLSLSFSLSCVVLLSSGIAQPDQNETEKPTYTAALPCRVRKTKHVMRSLDLRGTLELIDSRIHQRWHSKERHKADSFDSASFTWIFVWSTLQNESIIKFELKCFPFSKRLLFLTCWSTPHCVNTSEKM